MRIDPDAVRERLPDYDDLMQRGAVDLVEKTQARVTQLSDKMLEKAVACQRSFVFDASGKDRDWYLGLIRRLVEAGFEVTIVLAYCRPEVARARCDERAEINGRYVDAAYFKHAHAQAPANFIRYAQHAKRFILIKNDQLYPVWVWHRSAEGGVVHQRQFLEDYLARFADSSELAGSFPAEPGLARHDPWFLHVRGFMETRPGWDLSLETSYSEEG